jgi:hypothetical protein
MWEEIQTVSGSCTIIGFYISSTEHLSSINIVACLLKASRDSHCEGTALQTYLLLGHSCHMVAATDTHATIELLEAVFSMQFVLRLHNVQ